VPLFHAVSADLNTTLALAIISFFVAEFSGIFTLGVLKYGSKFVNLRGGAMGFIVGLSRLSVTSRAWCRFHSGSLARSSQARCSSW
jgi:F0F1-type ATP synthase membrane subunit a